MHIRHIDQLLPAIEGKAEFVHIKQDGYQVIDYVFQQDTTFDDPRLLECRGVKFDAEGAIIARPLRKFFNYGERNTKLPIYKPHVVTEKLDGSMVHPAIVGGQMFLMTRKGHTDIAKRAERHVMSDRGTAYVQFFWDALLRGWTPVFEYVGPDNRIVLRYQDRALVLLAMRRTVEGDFMPRKELIDWAAAHEVLLAREADLPLRATQDVASFVDHARGLRDEEGYVVYFDDGHVVKLKAYEYVTMHRAVDDLGSKKKVVALVLSGLADDVNPILDEGDRADLDRFEKGLMDEVRYHIQFVNRHADNIRSGSMPRKQFARDFAPFMPYKWLPGCIFAEVDGKGNVAANVRDALIKNPGHVVQKWRGK